MRIALISTKHASLSSGGEVRIYYLREGLKKKFQVDFIMPKITASFNFFTRLKHLLQGKIPYFEYVKTATLSKEEIEQIQKADLIQVEELESYFAVKKYLGIFNKPISLDAHNIEFKKFLAGTETEGFFIKWLGRILSTKVKQIEIQSAKKIDYILTCSEDEKKYFSQYVPATNICCIPNGVKNTNINHSPTDTKNILFMGLLSYGPNADGIRYYLDNIHHFLISKYPDLIVTIIGRNPPDWINERAAHDKTIVIKGFVESVEAELTNATVCICPIRFGSGTRLKVLEYMAAGKPVVSTSIGAEGIHVKDGTDILLADTPIQFATAIAKLLNDKILANRVGMNGEKIVAEQYNWEKIQDKLNTFYMNKIKTYV